MRRIRAGVAPKAAGSPSLSEPAFLAVGKLRRAHGVRGEILMEVLTDFPERLVSGLELYLGPEVKPVKLLKSRSHREGLLMTFEGFSTPEDVGQLRNQMVYVHAADRPPLEEGEYYHHQLIGLQVSTEEGEVIGTVSEIMETGGSDVLAVRQDFGPDVLIPIVDEFVKRINLTQGMITVHLIPGLRGEEG